MPQRQYTAPLMIRDGQAVRLHRVDFRDRSFDEGWLQKLLFEHPALIPIHEIEHVFGDLIPVARELPTAAGPIDVLYMNAQGFLTLVETKLWRNPEARRSVMAQIIDYAKEMARWSYSDLVEAVRKANGTATGDPLVELAREADEEFDEVTFFDRVSRNLQRGQFLLLIVGDGIREDMEHMAEFLQQTPQLAFTLGLVEIGVYRMKPDQPEPLFVQPRIVARTQEVVRAVVEIKVPISRADIQVTLPPKEEQQGRRKITEEEFFEELARTSDLNAVELSKWALANAESHQLQVSWGDAGPQLRWTDDPTGIFFNFGQLNRNGYLTATERLWEKCKAHGLLEVGADYSDQVTSLIPGAYRKKSKHSELLALRKPVGKSDSIPLAMLWPCKDQWFAAIDQTIAKLREALDNSAKG